MCSRRTGACPLAVLLSAQFLGRRGGESGDGARMSCFLIASLMAMLRRGSNLVSISLAAVGHLYVSWVAANGALHRGHSSDLFLMAVFPLFFCCRRSFRVFHSSSVSFVFVGVGRGVVGFCGQLGDWGWVGWVVELGLTQC